MLIEAGASERSLVARLFVYMVNLSESTLADDVKWDCEYNRRGFSGKPKDLNGSKIIPDVILHKRGDNTSNICALEFKWNKPSRRDYCKLSSLTSGEYNYRYGIQVVFNRDRVDLIWFRNGGEEPYSYESYRTDTWEPISDFAINRPHERRRNVTLMITRECNLRCSYCYEPYKTSDKSMRMEFATAQALLRKEFAFVLNSEEFDEIEIDFMGGEPLVNFPLIKKIVEWLEAEPPLVPYICFATTNGTLVHKHAAWLRKHRRTFQLGGSYDGTTKMQRTNRGTGHGFENNIDLLYSLYPRQGFHMVISKETLPDLAEGVLAIQRKGYVLDVTLAQGVDWSKEDSLVFRRELEKLVKVYLCDDNHLKPIDIFVRSLATIADNPVTVRQRKYCGAGTHMVTYDYDGKAYGCHLFTPLVLGDRAKEIDELDFRCGAEDADRFCKFCRLKGVCPTCAGFNYRYRNDIGLRDHHWCHMVYEMKRAVCVFQIKKLARCKNLTEEEVELGQSAIEAWQYLEKEELVIERR